MRVRTNKLLRALGFMFSTYFADWEVKPGYKKEYVSLWSDWLGKENYDKLDEVTEKDWGRFNNWIRLLSEKFAIELVNCENESLQEITDIESVLSNYEESMNKDASLFLKIVLPELGCIISEEWDYTYIIWHKENGAVKTLAPYIQEAGLKNFHD